MPDKKKSDFDKLSDKLTFKKEIAWLKSNEQEQKEVFQLSEDYKVFLDNSKTERESIVTIEKLAKEHGYINIKDAKKGDKKLFLQYDKVCGALVYLNDTQNFENGFLMNGAHIDVPRIDLKQFPLYEAENMAYMKTHYYGGIKKYQWVCRPLALHGTIIKEDGTEVLVNIGEDDTDPVFTINDLLPHLGRDQMQKKAGQVVEGEQLNILVGSIPYKFTDKKDAVKLNVLNHLYKKYNIIEEDFTSAELQLVPAGKSKDVGFDRSFVGAHGHDDRICSYLGMRALFDVDKSQTEKNLMMVFFDKEEIGSAGNSGANSNLIERMVNDVLRLYGNTDYNTLIKSLENSKHLSSDVGAGIDPAWAGVTEPLNAPAIGKGVAVLKFTGVGGKGGSNEAHAEFYADVRKAFNKDGVIWQNAELGKVDQGGGGTVAQYLASYGMDVIDCGVPVLSMHSPFEIASKIDIYHTYKAYIAFFKYL